MKKRISLLIILGAWVVFCCVGCGDDSDNNNEDTGPGDTGEPDAGDSETEDNDTGLPPTIALEEDFEDWDDTDREFFMAKPEYEEGDEYNYEDNATMVEIDSENCIMLHDNTVDNNGYGFAIEFQLALDDPPVDMSFGNFTVDFDVYVTQEIFDMGANVQFGFYWIGDDEWTPIYSTWYSGSIVADEWSHLTGTVNIEEGFITYNGFNTDNTDDWVFDVFRIQLILNGDDIVAEGDEIYFYVDNIVIKNFED